jgi:hypothetical protein
MLLLLTELFSVMFFFFFFFLNSLITRDADKYKSTAEVLRHTSEDKNEKKQIESKELRNRIESLQTFIKNLESELETLRVQ